MFMSGIYSSPLLTTKRDDRHDLSPYPQVFFTNSLKFFLSLYRHNLPLPCL